MQKTPIGILPVGYIAMKALSNLKYSTRYTPPFPLDYVPLNSSNFFYRIFVSKRSEFRDAFSEGNEAGLPFGLDCVPDAVINAKEFAEDRVFVRSAMPHEAHDCTHSVIIVRTDVHAEASIIERWFLRKEFAKTRLPPLELLRRPHAIKKRLHVTPPRRVDEAAETIALRVVLEPVVAQC